MPGKLKVKVVSGRGLPVMDRSTDSTDAFVEIRFASEVQKTDVYKKSLSPQWNSEWFRFEVEDEALQDEPLELRVLDHDTYSAHDAIGKIYVDLNPLLTKDSSPVITGWFPIYDTMHGIRGEINIIVKIDLFSDFNKFRQSSCGIQFFCTAEVPSGYRLQYIHGFVEELVVNDDPEYQWIDKIRTPRASNEARQRLFSKMSGTLTRKIGLKVMEMGGSAVIGYNQCFDLEGESGIVIRGIGTAVTLNKVPLSVSPQGVSPMKDHRLHYVPHLLHLGHNPRCSTPLILSSTPPVTPNPHSQSRHSPQTRHSPSRYTHSHLLRPNIHLTPPSAPPCIPAPSSSHFEFDFPCSSPLPEDSVTPSSPPSHEKRSSTSPVKVLLPVLTRVSSDSDVSCTTPPKGACSCAADSSGSGSGTGSGSKGLPKPCLQQINIELMEFPLFTMKSFPVGFIIHLGGVVSARSVKLLDKIHNPEEPETRDAWWMEIRTEIRSHTRAMGCHAVIGYAEHTSICDEIIVLSAIGTAARVNLNMDQYPTCIRQSQQMVVVADRHLVEREREKDNKLFVDVNLANQMSQRMATRYESSDDWSPHLNCGLCHIPYKTNNAPFPINLSLCSICRRKKVPDILFSTINPPAEIQILGKGAFIQARVCRTKANSKAEANAKEISDILPFLEYELHNQLVNKLKIRSMNGLFGLKIQVTVGENMLIGIATATGAFLAPLPAPPTPRLLGQVTSEEENVALLELQRKLYEKVEKYKDVYQLSGVELSNQPSPRSATTDDSDDEVSELELSTGNKDTFILQVDDTKDEAIEAMLQDVCPPVGMEMCNTQTLPGHSPNTLLYNLQMFTQVWRREVDWDQRLELKMRKIFTHIFDSILKKIFFKLRRMTPCCLCDISFNVEVPDEDEIQVVVSGVCVAMDNTPTYDAASCDITSAKTMLKPGSGASGASGEPEDMMFQMEEIIDGSGTADSVKGSKPVKQEPIRRVTSHVFPKQHGRIDLTPQSFVAGAKIERYMGSYNFFFIRETTSLREMGGICGFIQSFISEVLAIVRANVASLGGNALVAYKMSHCVLLSNPHKNQSQCLINVCGDAVCTSSEGEITAIIPDLGRKHSDT